MNFDELGLIEPLRLAVTAAGYTVPTPIQVASIPVLLLGGDLCGTAQTGTGKTAAFALPILQRLATTPGTGGIRALILAPTRELAVQINEAFAVYGRNLPDVRHAVVFGGMGMRAQRRAIEAGVDVLVATPGRLLDLCGQGVVRLDKVECFVLDEADRMLDMGFINDVRTLIKRLPARRQTVLFSATLPKDIEQLVKQILRNPTRVSVAPASSVADRIQQTIRLVEKGAKGTVLLQILADPAITRAVVFTRTRHGADRIAARLRTSRISAEAIHADRTQPERARAMADFTQGFTRVLVATDIAARGIDIDGITHVINFDVPNVPETYVHRIGRTARAGAAGHAITLCSTEELPYLKDIERLTKQKIVPTA
ncbi:MAG: DEAD/DEAH box helicase [Pseudomonadota bacterium]|nr:DEAD/DEAH box helicase [Pseudomonadota bacterium]